MTRPLPIPTAAELRRFAAKPMESRLARAPRVLLRETLQSLVQNDAHNFFLTGDVALLVRGVPLNTDTIEVVIDPREIDEVLAAFSDLHLEVVDGSGSHRSLSENDFAHADHRAFRLNLQGTKHPGKLAVTTSAIRIPEFDNEFLANDVLHGDHWDTATQVAQLGLIPTAVITAEALAAADSTSLQRLRRLERAPDRSMAIQAVMLADKTIDGGADLFAAEPHLASRHELATLLAASLGLPQPEAIPPMGR